MNLLPFLFQTTFVFLRNGNCLSLVENPPIMFHKRSAYMPSEGGDYPLCVAPLRLCCLSAAKACCKADQRPPAAELTFWLSRHGSFVEGNTVFCMEELQLYGPTVPTFWSPVMVSTIPGIGWRVVWVRVASIRRPSLILLVMGCEAPLFPLPLSFDCFIFCASLQFNSTPAVFDCIRDELRREAHYRHNTRTINSWRLCAKFPNSLCWMRSSFWHLWYIVRQFRCLNVSPGFNGVESVRRLDCPCCQRELRDVWPLLMFLKCGYLSRVLVWCNNPPFLQSYIQRDVF